MSGPLVVLRESGRSLRALITLEWRLQWRSLRFRLSCALFLAFALAPALILWSFRETTLAPLLAQTLLERTYEGLRFASMLLCWAVVGVTRSHGRELQLLEATPATSLAHHARRIAAHATLIVPLSVVPIVVMTALSPHLLDGVVRWSDQPTRWFFEVAIPLLIMLVLWSSLLTLLRSEVPALLALVTGGLVLQSTINALLSSSSTLIGHADWMGGGRLLETAQKLYWVARSFEIPLRFLQPSEAPFAPPAFTDLIPVYGLPLGSALLLFLISARYLRRAEPDVKPWRIPPDHQLRTLLASAARLRLWAIPDPWRHPAELLVAIPVLGVALYAVWLPIEKSRTYGEVFERQYLEFRSPREVTAPGLTVVANDVRGQVEESGRSSLDVTQVLENRGLEPVREIAFELNRGFETAQVQDEMGSLKLEAGSGRATLVLRGPLGPGERTQLSWRLDGVPIDLTPALRGLAQLSFVRSYEIHKFARFARYRSNLGRSRARPLVTPRRLQLDGPTLAPRVRYTSWEVDRETARVPRERVDPALLWHVRLDIPSGWVVGDSCGAHAVGGAAGATRLESSCRVPATEYRIRGGERSVERSGRVLLGLFDVHAESAGSVGDAMDHIVGLSSRAWPGLDAVDSLVAVEWPEGETAEAFGHLIVLPEIALRRAVLTEANRLVADVLSMQLLQRSAGLTEDDRFGSQQRFLRHFLGSVMLARMGEGSGSAVITVRPWWRFAYRQPLVAIRSDEVWPRKLDAIVVALRETVGAERLQRAIEELLERGMTTDVGPATVPSQSASNSDSDVRPAPERLPLFERFFAALAEQLGPDAQRIHDDFVVGNAMPEPRLEAARLRAERGGWEVQVDVVNQGRGSTRCEVVLVGDGDRHGFSVPIEPGEHTLRLVTAMKPHTVELDPAGRCLRYRATQWRDSLGLTAEAAGPRRWS